MDDSGYGTQQTPLASGQLVRPRPAIIKAFLHVFNLVVGKLFGLKTKTELLAQNAQVEPYEALFNNVRIQVESTEESRIFRVPKRYIQIEYLGGGAQGIAVTAFDQLLQRKVVIKSVLDFGRLQSLHPDDVEPTRRRLLQISTRELLLLKALKHENLLQLLNVFTPNPDLNSFTELFHVTPFAGQTLHELRKTLKERNICLQHEMISFIMFQLLSATDYLHGGAVVHRDLKPTNIAIDEKLHVTILDMGWSRRVDPNATLTRRVGTMIYNAPELLYKLNGEYDARLDIWSLGCIMAELIRGEHVFTGKTIDAIYSNITKLRGSPNNAQFYDRFVTADQTSMKARMGRTAVDLAVSFPDSCFGDGAGTAPLTSANARNLLDMMLQMDFEERPTAADCLRHPYLTCWVPGEKREFTPEAKEIVKAYDASLENDHLSTSEWKSDTALKLLANHNLELLYEVLAQYRNTNDAFVSPQ